MMDGDFNACYENALRFLDYRPRSETELKNYLLFKRKYGAGTVTAVLKKLKQARLVDDGAFALAWADDRVTHKQKSRAMVRHELLGKGIDPATVDLATADIDDEVNALKAGLKKARLIAGSDYTEFSQRLAAYLARRAYSPEVVHRVIPLLWERVKGEKRGK